MASAADLASSANFWTHYNVVIVYLRIVLDGDLNVKKYAGKHGTKNTGFKPQALLTIHSDVILLYAGLISGDHR